MSYDAEGWTIVGVVTLVAATVLFTTMIVQMGHNGVDLFETCINAGNEWVKGVCLLP